MAHYRFCMFSVFNLACDNSDLYLYQKWHNGGSEFKGKVIFNCSFYIPDILVLRAQGVSKKFPPMHSLYHKYGFVTLSHVNYCIEFNWSRNHGVNYIIMQLPQMILSDE